jgi:glutamyl-tRNA reductase
MTLLACGINHLTAPIELREQFAFPPERARDVLKHIMQMPAVNEAMILSTCNRVEIYSHTSEPETFRTWLQQYLDIKLEPHWYSFHEKQAVSHIMRVASGLDSMVLGESQILGQMKTAFSLALEVGSIGAQFQKLFQTVFNVTKQVRTDTSIGANPITLGYAATSLAKQIFSDLSKRNVLLIGSGEIIELAGLHLYNQGVKRFIVAGRSANKTKSLAEKLYGHAISLSEIPVYLKESDIVISATSSQLPILGKGAVESAIKARKHRPIFMVDLAVPRDIEPEVGAFEDIYLYNIDDLKSIIDDNRQCRQAAAQQAENIIDLQASHFIKDLQSLEANVLIRQYREQIEKLSATELERALVRLNQGTDSKQVLSQFAAQLTNKLCHGPTVQMKKAAFDGRLELLAFARLLLDL